MRRRIGQLCTPAGVNYRADNIVIGVLSRLFNGTLKLHNFQHTVSGQRNDKSLIDDYLYRVPPRVAHSLSVIIPTRFPPRTCRGAKSERGRKDRSRQQGRELVKIYHAVWVFVARSTVSGSEDLNVRDEQSCSHIFYIPISRCALQANNDAQSRGQDSAYTYARCHSTRQPSDKQTFTLLINFIY